MTIHIAREVARHVLPWKTIKWLERSDHKHIIHETSEPTGKLTKVHGPLTITEAHNMFHELGYLTVKENDGSGI